MADKLNVVIGPRLRADLERAAVAREMTIPKLLAQRYAKRSGKMSINRAPCLCRVRRGNHESCARGFPATPKGGPI
jgi:hypothetical protein